MTDTNPRRGSTFDSWLAEEGFLQKWISVKDQLPDNSKINSVLITDGTDIYVAVEWWPDENPLKTDWSYSYCCGCKANGITHWMPLPELPK